MEINMIKLATLFSGIGAIEQTLKKMGIKYKIIFACDNGEREVYISDYDMSLIDKFKSNKEKQVLINKYYSNLKKINFMEKSYKANYDINDNNFYQDVRFLNGEEYQNRVDLLVGGSPCQSFSVNGKQGGFDDTRGTLFYEYARIIKETQPKCFIFENVKGMLTHHKGKTWNTIKNTFNELNYNIYIRTNSKGEETPILNAYEFGIPQNRPRIYVVGIRNDLNLKDKFIFPKPIKLCNKVSDYLDKEVDPKYYLGKKGFEFVTTHPSRAQVGCDIMRCQKANQQFNWNGDFIFEPIAKVQRNEKILKKAFVGEFKGEIGVIRKFTPRECLRLMGFLDDFQIVVDDTMMYRQAGNSIVVNVLEKLMEELMRVGVFND